MLLQLQVSTLSNVRSIAFPPRLTFQSLYAKPLAALELQMGQVGLTDYIRGAFINIA